MISTISLKWIALVGMVVDHLAWFFPDVFPLWFHWIGRIVFPIFAFCLAEGFDHTHSRRNYLLQLYLGGLLLSFADSFASLHIGMNIFKTLFQMGLLLALIDAFKRKDHFWEKLALYVFVQASAITILKFCFVFWSDHLWRVSVNLLLQSLCLYDVDGGLLLMVIGVIFYLTKENKKMLAMGYSAYCLTYIGLVKTNFIAGIIHQMSQWFGLGGALFIQFVLETIVGIGGFGWFLGPESSLLTDNYQWMMIAALPLILLYNGERGQGPKWFFYFFYPAHLIVLSLAARMVGVM